MCMTVWRKPPLFIDRDGTLVEEVNYLSRLEQMVLIPGVGPLLARANQAGMPVIVVSNQSGVARGYITEAFVQESERHLAELLAGEGVHMDGFFYCPHHPSGLPPYNIECGCRKPQPGMLLQARNRLGLTLEGGYMIGDRGSDTETGVDFGLIPLLVRTGYGQQAEPKLPAQFFARKGQVFDALPQALAWILQRENIA